MANRKQENINALKLSFNDWLTGVDQYDSPGFYANYCTNFFMDLNSSIVIEFKKEYL